MDCCFVNALDFGSTTTHHPSTAHTNTPQLYWTLKILPWRPTHTTYVLWRNLLSSCTPPKINNNSQTIKQLLLVADRLSRSKKPNTHTHDISNWKLGYIMRNLWNLFIIFLSPKQLVLAATENLLISWETHETFLWFLSAAAEERKQKKKRPNQSVCVCVWGLAKFRQISTWKTRSRPIQRIFSCKNI
jgi:hypothetical protein